MSHEPHGLGSRADRRAARAWAFDRRGEHDDEAFAHKAGRIAAGERLPSASPVRHLGCGTGTPTAPGTGHKVTGADGSEEMPRLARDVRDAEFAQGDNADVDLGGFAACVAFFSPPMLPRAEITSVLTEINRRVEPGGCFPLSVAEPDPGDSPIGFLGSPVAGYPRAEPERPVTVAGDLLDPRRSSYAPAGTGLSPETRPARRDGRR